MIESGEDGAALIEVILAAVILAIMAVAALSVTSGAAGLLVRGVYQSRGAQVLDRVLGIARLGQGVPGTFEGFSVASSSSQVTPWRDAWVVRYSTNPSCQGNCGIPFDATRRLNRIEVTVSGSGPEASRLTGATFTTP